MAHSTAQQIRAWHGPALFSYGFRPFFLFAAIWAVGAMCIWIAVFSLSLELPSRFDPVSWHAHEFLFGYLGAILAGFLLTAVPNWTGRLPIVGWRLAGLSGLWLVARAAILVSSLLPVGLAAAIDLAFPLVLGVLILREIIAGKNWRNLIILALLTLFTLANALFHIEAASGGYAAQGFGLRLGLGTVIIMISLIGGRIIPSFTRNWLVRTNHPARPASPMQNFDIATLILSIGILSLWVVEWSSPALPYVLILMGLMHLIRLFRWQGHCTLEEPLVWVLHASYAFIPAGAFTLAASHWSGNTFDAAAQHLWMAGAIGSMTLAVMTRATLGHTGCALKAGKGTLCIYISLFGAVATRLGANAEPALNTVSGILWLMAFGSFALIYGPLLAHQRK